MSGIIGKKVGMTSIFDESGRQVVCTVVEAGPNVVTQVKTADGKDGYDAVQLAYGEKKAKNVSKALVGHFDQAGTSPKARVSEFRNFELEVGLGDEVRPEDLFEVGELVSVAGTSKGKGFQGVVKRHGFSGVGEQTHGQHNRERAPGSIGAASDPSRVFKGMRMAGRTGNSRATIKNLRVVKIIPDQNAILIQGSVPGAKGNYVEILKQPRV
ncbi:MAG: 50S ribosomal protein L3 [Candidatus Wenzhouxiangella sp. M2_3B_020]